MLSPRDERTGDLIVEGDITVNPSEHGDSESSRQTSLDGHGKEKNMHTDWSRWTLKKRAWRRQVTPFDQLVNHHYVGKGTADDPFHVTWIEDDPENPLNQSTTTKWLLLAYVSVSTLCVTLASSGYTGATRSIKAELGGSEIVITLGIALFVLGLALGPLIMAPISEVVGRRNTYLVAFSFFTLWNAVAIASPNLASLIVFRFLAGAFGSCPMTSAGGSIADVFHARDRGLAITLFASCPFLGPALGPITGGFLGESAG